MSFAPVFLSPGRELNGRASQTFIRHFNSCPRSAFLYQETKGNVQTVEMLRGTVVHEIKERCTALMVSRDEPMIPWELAKVIVDEVLAEYPLPIEEHDYVRESAYRWACEFTIDPEQVVAIETLIVLEIGGWQIRCKIDFAELRLEGRQIYVGDYKSGKGAPNYDEIARKRKRPHDGISPFAARNIQLILYVLALVYGKPVRVEPCERCGGKGELVRAKSATSWVEYRVDDLGPLAVMDSVEKRPIPCPDCRHGRIETIEPFALAPRAQEAIAEFVYPGIEDDEGRMLRRTVGLTGLEIVEYRESLEAIVANLERAEKEGDWPAIVSDIACDQCPCSARCPIPAELRDHRGEINTLEQLVEAAERYYRDNQALKARRREIKGSAKKLGDGPRSRVRFGEDRVWEVGDVKTSVEIPDKEGMFAAIERAVEFGEPFDPSDWTKDSKTTPFGERRLSEDELEEESQQRQEAANDG